MNKYNPIKRPKMQDFEFLNWSHPSSAYFPSYLRFQHSEFKIKILKNCNLEKQCYFLICIFSFFNEVELRKIHQNHICV